MIDQKYIQRGGGVILNPPLETDAVYERVFTIGAEPAESFDWRPYLPLFETQRATFDCTCFSRTNCGEYVGVKAGIKDHNGNEINFSDLHLAVEANNTLNGNDLNNPSEAFRKKGIVLQVFCQYDNDMLDHPAGTWAKRKQKVAAIPKDAKIYFGGNHSWVAATKAAMKDALQYSPLQIAVGLYN